MRRHDPDLGVRRTLVPLADRVLVYGRPRRGYRGPFDNQYRRSDLLRDWIDSRWGKRPIRSSRDA